MEILNSLLDILSSIRSALELVHQYLNTARTDTDNVYTSQDYDNLFDPSHFAAGTFTYLFEATLKTTIGASNTAYAQLWNETDSSQIDERTTLNGTYTRVRTGSGLTMPSSVKTLDTRLKNSTASGQTTSASTSWLIIGISSLQIPEGLVWAIPLALLLPRVIPRLRLRMRMLANGERMIANERMRLT